MSSFNKVILIGTLTRDPEVRFTQGGTAITSFGLALNESWTDKTTGEEKGGVTFLDVTIFGKRGEAFAKHHKKGLRAFVEGKLRQETWEDKNGGGKRTKISVVADHWAFVDNRTVQADEPPADTAPSTGWSAPSEFNDTPF